MLNVYAAASSSTGEAVLNLASEGPAPKGLTAVVAVALMFGILCGGIFMLLQSSFGPKVGYLITGTAFWGCWFVLSLLWFTGVPGLPLPGAIPDIPTSTPRFLGPQGDDASWQVIDTDSERAAFPTDESQFVEISPDLTDQGLMAEITAAETAASEEIGPDYAEVLGVEESSIVAGQTFRITQTEIIRSNRKVTRARVTTGPVETNDTQSEDTKALIARIQPRTYLLALEGGTLAQPTYVAMGVTLLLFLAHVGGLAVVDRKPASTPAGVPERESVPA